MAAGVYLQIDGVNGESNDDKHKGWIEVEAVDWGVTQPTAGTMSTAGGHTIGRAVFDAIRITKTADLASPKLTELAAQGKTIPKAKLEFFRGLPPMVPPSSPLAPALVAELPAWPPGFFLKALRRATIHHQRSCSKLGVVKVTLIGRGDLMLHVDTQGYVLNARVQRAPRPLIERGVLQRISGIIVHQTGGASGTSKLE